MGRSFRQAVRLATTLPVPEAVAPLVGVMPEAARADHIHQRLTSVTEGATAVNGEATIVFTRSFPTKPGVTLMPEESADNGALIGKIRSFTQSGGLYTGCVIRFYRVQPLPNVLVLLSALLNFRVDAGTVGVLPFTCIAVMRSD